MIRDSGVRRCGTGLLLLSIGVQKGWKSDGVCITTVWKREESEDEAIGVAVDLGINMSRGLARLIAALMKNYCIVLDMS